MPNKLVKATPEICGMCQYRSGTSDNGCNYWRIEGISRIFVDGKLKYDPNYCDKFVRGKKIEPNTEITLGKALAEKHPMGFNPWQE